MDAVLVVAIFPLASSTKTVTAGVMDDPAAVFVGCCPKTSWVALPAVMLNAVLVVPVNPLLAAVSV
jgi:hypothetical protein